MPSLRSDLPEPASFSYIQATHQLHLFPSNPYPPPPPPIAHKVWILDCRSCRTFLTNRAMKAVLLLRPNVSLYSSDALPVNCSAYTSNPEALRPPGVQKSAQMSSRTCECLTQTLCCHGCGNTIGYMIVIPCTRCTSSITATNRATNGHRFVFHSSEVGGTERHYIKDEPGVIPFEPTPFLPPTQFAPSPSPRYSSVHSEEYTPDQHLRSDYLPTPPLEFARPLPPASRHQSPEPDVLTSYYRTRSPPSLSRRSQNQPSPHSADSLSDSTNPPSFTAPTFSPADHKDSQMVPPSLQPGGVIFWHHLARSGEIPGVMDNARARDAELARMTGLHPRSLLFNR